MSWRMGWLGRIFDLGVSLAFWAFAFLTPTYAHAQTKAANPDLSVFFNEAMEAVAVAELEAPEASRVYVLLAITLYDSYHRARKEPVYFIDAPKYDSLQVGNIVSESLMAERAQTLLAYLFPDQDFNARLNGSRSDLSSVAFVKNLLVALPKPAEIIQYSEETGEKLVLPEWAGAPPLELASADMFRPAGPPGFDNTDFLVALQHVQRDGENISEFRLADASLSAAFWGNPAGTKTPPGHWNRIALEAIEDLPLERQLDVLLALNIALYDVGIAAWDCKYHFNSIRPHAYIRSHDTENPDWTAMGTVPLHPEYVSGHSAFSGAAAEILTQFLGQRSFCNISEEMWNLERCFSSFSAAAKEAGQSRIYGGLHFDFSNRDGLELGRDVAKNTLEHLQKKAIIELSISK